MGPFELLKDDVPVVFARKAQKKPFSLLGALVAFGPKGASVERLCDALWPDAEGDKALHAFNMALHRLRKLMGDPKALVLQAGRLSLDPRRCWVDAWALERILGQALAAWQKGPQEQAVDRTQSALALYRGPFLSEDGEGPWAIPLRERLKGMLLQTAERSGLRCEGLGEWEAAAEWYERVIEREPALETLYCRLMTCHGRLGRPAEVASVFERCRSVLRTHLGISPSPPTVALLQRLTGRHATRFDRSSD
jgi:DNA-binding SARP family transcriptional activator